MNRPAVTVLLLLAGMLGAAEPAVVVEQDGGRTGSEIRFRISGPPGPYPYRLLADGSPRRSGEAKAGDSIAVSPEQPGFALLSVDYLDEAGKKRTVRAGAGTGWELIRPARPAPADFDAFWAEVRAELAAVPLRSAAKSVPVPERFAGKVAAWDIRVETGSVPVSGYLAMPAGAAPKSLPALVNFHGAGVRSAAMPLAEAARGILAFDVNAHGIDNGREAAYYRELDRGELADYRRRDAGDRSRCYYRGMFQRACRALEYLKSRPEWDGRILIVSGGSQGGAQALAAAGLDPQVTCCVALVPALCDHHGLLAGRQPSWPYLIRRRNGVPVDPAVVESAGYFDCAHFAARVNPEAACFLSLGLLDTKCPPSSVCAAFNALKTKHKKLHMAERQGHTLTRDVFGLGDAFIDEHIKAMRATHPSQQEKP